MQPVRLKESNRNKTQDNLNDIQTAQQVYKCNSQTSTVFQDTPPGPQYDFYTMAQQLTTPEILASQCHSFRVDRPEDLDSRLRRCERQQSNSVNPVPMQKLRCTSPCSPICLHCNADRIHSSKTQLPPGFNNSSFFQR